MLGFILDFFFWFLDILIFLMVAFVSLSLVLFIVVFVRKHFFDEASKRFQEWVYEASEEKLTVDGLLMAVLCIIVLCRTFYLAWWKQYDTDLPKYAVTFSGSWLPFHLLYNYTVDVYPITAYINKLYFSIAVLLFLPIYGLVAAKVSELNKPYVQIGTWLIRNHAKLFRGKDGQRLTDEQLLKAIFSATVAYKERQIEKEILENEIHRLEKNSTRLHSQVKKERDKNASLLLKLTEQEKQLKEQEKVLASKPPSMRVLQSRMDDCMCVICMERPRQYNIKPCNHFCVCNICKPTLKNKCPLCRNRVQRFERIFLNLE